MFEICRHLPITCYICRGSKTNCCDKLLKSRVILFSRLLYNWDNVFGCLQKTVLHFFFLIMLFSILLHRLHNCHIIRMMWQWKSTIEFFFLLGISLILTDLIVWGDIDNWVVVWEGYVYFFSFFFLQVLIKLLIFTAISSSCIAVVMTIV
jgi:hypothetical protein